MGSRRRKEPARDNHERDRERERGKEYERDGRDGRGGRGYHRRDDYDHSGPGPVHRSSRDYGRDRDRDMDRDKGFERDRDRDYGGKKDEPPRRRERGRERKSSGAKEWEDVKREARRSSRSSPPREREKRDMYEDRGSDDRAEKVICSFYLCSLVINPLQRARYDGPPSTDRMDVDDKTPSPTKSKTENGRAESPEEGEI